MYLVHRMFMGSAYYENVMHVDFKLLFFGTQMSFCLKGFTFFERQSGREKRDRHHPPTGSLCKWP